MKKKGGINMSINMIIVLIIAVVIIGLALTFVQNMFGQLSGNLKESLPSTNVPVTQDNPIGIPDKVVLQEGKQRGMKVKVLNNKNSKIGSGASISLTCKDMGNMTKRASMTSEVPVGETGSALIVFKAKNSITSNDICTVKIPTTGNETIKQKFFVKKQ